MVFQFLLTEIVLKLDTHFREKKTILLPKVLRQANLGGEILGTSSCSFVTTCVYFIPGYI